jgi:hypothetical protein
MSHAMMKMFNSLNITIEFQLSHFYVLYVVVCVCDDLVCLLPYKIFWSILVNK